MQRFCVLALAALLPACATIVEGTSDTVTISTTPSGATCMVERAGERIAAVPSTPGSVRIDKSRHDLSVTCSREGYRTATVAASPRFTGTTFGNLLVGGVIGVAVDAASGANSRYPSDVRLELAETPRPPEPRPPVPAEPVEAAPQQQSHRRLRGAGV